MYLQLKAKSKLIFNTLTLFGILLFSNADTIFAGNMKKNSSDTSLYFSFSGSAVMPEDASLDSANPSLASLVSLLEAEVVTRSGFGINLASGIDFKNPFRLEIEYAFKKTDVARVSSLAGETSIGGSLTTQSFLTNLFLDFQTTENVKFNLGLGTGIAVIDGSKDLFGHNTEPAGQFIAGISYTPYNSYEFFTNYKYLSISRFDLNGASLDLATHNLELGLRFYFDHAIPWEKRPATTRRNRNKQ